MGNMAELLLSHEPGYLVGGVLHGCRCGELLGNTDFQAWVAHITELAPMTEPYLSNLGDVGGAE